MKQSFATATALWTPIVRLGVAFMEDGSKAVGTEEPLDNPVYVVRPGDTTFEAGQMKATYS